MLQHGWVRGRILTATRRWWPVGTCGSSSLALPLGSRASLVTPVTKGFSAEVIRIPGSRMEPAKPESPALLASPGAWVSLSVCSFGLPKQEAAPFLRGWEAGIPSCRKTCLYFGVISCHPGSSTAVISIVHDARCN